MSTTESAGTLPFDAEADFCADHGMLLERLPHYGWLVRRVEHDQTGPVIGCIDEVDGGVELMQMDGGFRWTTFPSLSEAVSHMVAVVS